MTVRPNEPSTVGNEVGQEKKLNKFMISAISMIAIVGLISILLLMFGDFESKGVRVFSTLVLFGAFTLFVALDTRKERSDLYMMVSQVGHIYMLGMSLILIWASLIGQKWNHYFDEEEIILNLLGLVLIIKVAIILIQYISRYTGDGTRNTQLSQVARITSIALALTAVAFTVPLAFEGFMNFSDGYWRIAISILLFAGLTLSILSLMVWFFSDKTARVSDTLGSFGVGHKMVDERSQPSAVSNNVPVFSHEEENSSAPAIVVPAEPATEPTVAKNPDFNPPTLTAQPWPVYPTGMPLPAKPNGRPDFDALKDFAELCAKSERQWYS